MRILTFLLFVVSFSAFAQVKAPESVVVDAPKKDAVKAGDKADNKNIIDTPYYFSINLL